MIKINTQSDLIASILEQTDANAYAHDAEARLAFNIAILNNDLYLPIDENFEQQVESNKVGLRSVLNNGHEYVLLFSSVKTLGEFSGPNTRYVRVPSIKILTELRNRYALVNSGPYGRALRPLDIAEILSATESKSQDAANYG